MSINYKNITLLSKIKITGCKLTTTKRVSFVLVYSDSPKWFVKLTERMICE